MLNHLTTLAICMLALAGGAAQAQQARCVDANGIGYACKGGEATTHNQAMHSGQPSQQKALQFNFNAPNNEGRDMFARPHNSGLSHESMQQRLQQMDSAAAAARASQLPPSAESTPPGRP